MIWSLSHDHSERAIRTAGDERITQYGRRVVLLAESDNGIDGMLVASNCKFTVHGYPCASIDLFVWRGDSPAAEAVRDALAAVRHVFGRIAGAGIAVCPREANRRHLQAFVDAGFRSIGEVSNGEVMGIQEEDLPEACAPLNCQLALFSGVA